jgi:hypothetical protein
VGFIVQLLFSLMFFKDGMHLKNGLRVFREEGTEEYTVNRRHSALAPMNVYYQKCHFTLKPEILNNSAILAGRYQSKNLVVQMCPKI